MTDRSEILEELKTSIETWDVQKAVDATNRALEAGIEPKDIVNDSFASVWNHRNDIESNIEAYLFQSVRNRCLNYLRDKANWLRIRQQMQQV